MNHDITIRPAVPEDFVQIWRIFKRVKDKGDSYIYDHNTSEHDAYDIWFGNTNPYVAVLDKKIVGSFIIRQNKVGRGSHICNAAYMVDPDYHGQKIGWKMGKFSLEEAKRLGYQAIQFNIVVSTNERAVRLWKSLGFNIVGTLPKAFKHEALGYVDAYVMHQFLE